MEAILKGKWDEFSQNDERDSTETEGLQHTSGRIKTKKTRVGISWSYC